MCERPGNDILEIAVRDGQLLAGEPLAAERSGRATRLQDAVGVEEIAGVGVTGPADARRGRIHGEKSWQGCSSPPAGSHLSIGRRPTDGNGLRAIGCGASARRENRIVAVNVVCSDRVKVGSGGNAVRDAGTGTADDNAWRIRLAHGVANARGSLRRDVARTAIVGERREIRAGRACGSSPETTSEELRKWLEGLNDEDLGHYKM